SRRRRPVLPFWRRSISRAAVSGALLDPDSASSGRTSQWKPAPFSIRSLPIRDAIRGLAAGSSRPIGQAVSVGVADRLRSITDTGLGEEVVDVSFDGRLVDEE